MDVCASASSFSSQRVSSGGAADGLTTSSGCGSNVRATLGSPTWRARSAVRSRTSTWPRCTPSKVPHVMTHPLRALGNAARRSGIAQHHFGSPAFAFAHGDGDQLLVMVECRELARCHRADVLAVGHAPGVEIV